MHVSAVQQLIDEFNRLPGIGPRSAQRIAFHMLKQTRPDALRLAQAIVDAKDKVTFCTRCFNLAEGGECEICLDDRRETATICVVEEPKDVIALEKSRGFKGRYHVLQGALSPIDGVGADQLTIAALLRRIEPEAIEEVILCTNPNVEGDTTALYLARQLSERFSTVRVSRLASGLPAGSDLEYADPVTLGYALGGRRLVEN